MGVDHLGSDVWVNLRAHSWGWLVLVLVLMLVLVLRGATPTPSTPSCRGGGIGERKEVVVPPQSHFDVEEGNRAFVHGPYRC